MNMYIIHMKYLSERGLLYMNGVSRAISRYNNHREEGQTLEAACDLLLTGSYNEDQICRMLDMSHHIMRLIISILSWAEEHQCELWDDDDDDDDFDIGDFPFGDGMLDTDYKAPPREFALRGVPLGCPPFGDRPAEKRVTDQSFNDLTYPANWDVKGKSKNFSTPVLECEKRMMYDIIIWTANHNGITEGMLDHQFQLGEGVDRVIDYLKRLNVIENCEAHYKVNGIYPLIMSALQQVIDNDNNSGGIHDKSGIQIDGHRLVNIILWALSQDKVSVETIKIRCHNDDAEAMFIMNKLVSLGVADSDDGSIIPISLETIPKGLLNLMRAFNISDKMILSHIFNKCSADAPNTCAKAYWEGGFTAELMLDAIRWIMAQPGDDVDTDDLAEHFSINVSDAELIMAKLIEWDIIADESDDDDESENPLKNFGQRVKEKIGTEMFNWIISRRVTVVGELQQAFNLDDVNKLIIDLMHLKVLIPSTDEGATIDQYILSPVAIDYIWQKIEDADDPGCEPLPESDTVKTVRWLRTVLMVLANDTISLIGTQEELQVNREQARLYLDHLAEIGIVTSSVRGKPRTVIPTSIETIPPEILATMHAFNISDADLNQTFTIRQRN